jgi:hypothetical protein
MMKKVRFASNLLLSAALFSPLIAAADLSTYRGFQLGTSVSATVKHSGMDLSEVTTTHQRPARIQELTWRPMRFGATEIDPVEQVLFTFYNGQLFRMVVDYDSQKTEGLSASDMIEAVSVKYGAAEKPGVTMVLTSHFSEDTVQVAARWEDADYSFNLVQLPYASTFRLLIFSKSLNGLAEAAVADGNRIDAEEAPQRQKVKEQDDQSKLDQTRLVNKEHFRP